MATLKTQETNASVEDFLNSIENEQRVSDCRKLLEVFSEVMDEPAKMWGDSMVGYGSYHYKYDSGREGDWFLTGFSPRKQNLTIYIVSGFDKHKDLMKDLGKYKTSSSCLYVKKLADIDVEVLKKLIVASVQDIRKRYSGKD